MIETINMLVAMVLGFVMLIYDDLQVLKGGKRKSSWFLRIVAVLLLVVGVVMATAVILDRMRPWWHK